EALWQRELSCLRRFHPQASNAAHTVARSSRDAAVGSRVLLPPAGGSATRRAPKQAGGYQSRATCDSPRLYEFVGRARSRSLRAKRLVAADLASPNARTIG